MKPAVHIHEANANPANVAEICAGLEEEGIPHAIFNANGDVKSIATDAANHSKLRVGIGITQEFAMMQIRNGPTFAAPLTQCTKCIKSVMEAPMDILINETTQENDNPVLHIKLNGSASKIECRILGTNAARVVKGKVLV